MLSDKFLKALSQNLDVDPKLAEKIYNKFWDYIEEVLYTEGTADIPGLGTFYIQEKTENDKPVYSIQFKSSNSFKENVGA
jgi:nucleoid DNA-binding protein